VRTAVALRVLPVAHPLMLADLGGKALSSMDT